MTHAPMAALREGDSRIPELLIRCASRRARERASTCSSMAASRTSSFVPTCHPAVPTERRHRAITDTDCSRDRSSLASSFPRSRTSCCHRRPGAAGLSGARARSPWAAVASCDLASFAHPTPLLRRQSYSPWPPAPTCHLPLRPIRSATRPAVAQARVSSQVAAVHDGRLAGAGRGWQAPGASVPSDSRPRSELPDEHQATATSSLHHAAMPPRDRSNEVAGLRSSSSGDTHAASGPVVRWRYRSSSAATKATATIRMPSRWHERHGAGARSRECYLGTAEQRISVEGAAWPGRAENATARAPRARRSPRGCRPAGARSRSRGCRRGRCPGGGRRPGAAVARAARRTGSRRSCGSGARRSS